MFGTLFKVQHDINKGENHMPFSMVILYLYSGRTGIEIVIISLIGIKIVIISSILNGFLLGKCRFFVLICSKRILKRIYAAHCNFMPPLTIVRGH